MARTRNNLDFKNRRIEFIQESLKILFEEGYGKLGINYLIRRMDISKGSFFHYFKSKDDLVQALMDYLSQPIIDNMIAIQNNLDIDPIEKFTRLYHDTSTIKLARDDGFEFMTQMLFNEENKPFLNGITEQILRKCQPIYESVIEQGNDKGVFKAKSVHGTAYHILALTMHVNASLAYHILSDHDDQSYTELIERISTFEHIVQVLLNCSRIGPLYDLTDLKESGIL